jgi:hypothetical protein
MSKITYLLGAGASCNALPLVNNFKDRLDSFDKRLVENLQICMKSSTTTDFNEFAPFGGKKGKDLRESIFWLKDVADKHASIDTYAKKLFIRNDNEALKILRKLKATLSCYLLLEQSIQEADKRYDNFFASTLIRDQRGYPSLPNEVNIITWNYDTQLEKSFVEFCENPLFVYDGLTRNPNIIRLNGTCGLPNNDEMRDLCILGFNLEFLDSVIKLFERYTRIGMTWDSNISFAWEKNDLDDKIKSIFQGTTTLVIIGYSLPYFNRVIDKMIINTMYPKLENIFIQVPEKEYQGHKERLLTCYDNKLIRDFMENKIKMISGTDLFYIPDDMPR